MGGTSKGEGGNCLWNACVPGLTAAASGGMMNNGDGTETNIHQLVNGVNGWMDCLSGRIWLAIQGTQGVLRR